MKNMRIVILILGILLLAWGLAGAEYNRGMGIVDLPDAPFVEGQILQAVDANTARIKGGTNNTMLIGKSVDGELTYQEVYMDADIGTGAEGGCPAAKPILDLHLNGISDPVIVENFPHMAQPHFFCRELDLSLDLDLGNFTFVDNVIKNPNSIALNATGGPANAAIALTAAGGMTFATVSDRILLNAAGADVPVQLEWLKIDRNRLYGDGQYGATIWSTDNARDAEDKTVSYGDFSPGLEIRADGNLNIKAGYPVGDQKCVDNFCDGTTISCSQDSQCGCADGSPTCSGQRKSEAGIVTIDGDFTAADVIIESAWSFKDSNIDVAGDASIEAASGALTLGAGASTDADQSSNKIKLQGLVELQSANATLGDTNLNNVGLLEWDSTLTLEGTNTFIKLFNLIGTVTDNSNTFLNPTVLTFQPTINLGAQNAASLYTGFSNFYSQAKLVSQKSNLLLTAGLGDFYSDIIFDSSGAGSWSASSGFSSFAAKGQIKQNFPTLDGFTCGDPAVTAGKTLTNRSCFTALAHTGGAGTITTTIGFETEGAIGTAFKVASGATVGMQIASPTYGVTISGASNTALSIDSTSTDGLVNASTTVYTPDETTISAVGNTIPADASLVEVTVSGGNVTLSSQPSIAAGVDGQVLRVLNISSNFLTIQQGALRNVYVGDCSGVCSSGICTLGQREMVEFTYLDSVDSGTWVQTGCQSND